MDDKVGIDNNVGMNDNVGMDDNIGTIFAWVIMLA